MINEVLSAIRPLLPARLFILLPNDSEPDLVIFTDTLKATIHVDASLPVFVVVNRDDGHLLTWGEGVTVADAASQAMKVLESVHPPRASAA